jgi:hypothetical protein
LEAGGLFASFINSQTATASSELEKSAIPSKLESSTSVSRVSEVQSGLRSEVQSGENEASDLSLFSCLFRIAKAQRQHWLLMTAVFIPCFVGGKLLSSTHHETERLTLRSNQVSYMLAKPCSSEESSTSF